MNAIAATTLHDDCLKSAAVANVRLSNLDISWDTSLAKSIDSNVFPDMAVRMRGVVDAKDDPLILQAKQSVALHEATRKREGGPTAKKERFSPVYWNSWNQRLGILEAVSKKEQAEQQASKERQQPSTVLVAAKKNSKTTEIRASMR